MRCFLMALVMLLASQAQAHDWRESPAVGELFQRAGMKGTFVLYDVAARTYRGHDETRANQRFVPASTFKIPNSLIGLTVGAVAGPDEVLPYRGIPTPSSGVGAGHEPARGHPVVQRAHLSGTGPAGWPGAHGEQVARLDYGNRDIGTQVDRFWLDGPLQISAMEQVRFPRPPGGGLPPFPAAAQAAVRDITRPGAGARLDIARENRLVERPGARVSAGGWAGWTGRAVSSPLP